MSRSDLTPQAGNPGPSPLEGGGIDRSDLTPQAGDPGTTSPLVGTTAQRVVRVSGADRLAYLDAVLSQELSDVEVGTVRGALELDTHGAPTAALDIVVREDDVLLIVPDEEVAGEVVERLGSRTFLQDASFEHLDDVVLWVRGAGAQPSVADLGLPTPEEGRSAPAGGLTVVGRASGIDLVGPGDAIAPHVDALVEAGAEAADADRLDAWRIHAGEPAWAREIAPPHLPEELGLLPTHVHLTKGCYPGQEAVARMWMLGRPRRRLARVRLDEPVEPGTTIGKGRDRVEVTSVATWDGELVGLAFVPPDREPGDAAADGIEVVELVGEGLPVPGHDPTVKRRRDARGGRGAA